MQERCLSRSPMLERSLREIESGKYLFAVKVDSDPTNPNGVEAGKIVTISGNKVGSLHSLNTIDDFELDLVQVVKEEDPFSLLRRGVARLTDWYGYCIDQKTVESTLGLIRASELQTVSAAFRYTGNDGHPKTVVVFPQILSASRGVEEAVLISAAFTQISPPLPFARVMAQARY